MSDESTKKFIVHSKRRILEDFFSIDEVQISFEGRDGHMFGPMRRLSFERGDSVAVLVLKRDPSPKILLVKQFKYPASIHGDGWIIETVAGMIDSGESAEQALQRELIEELGYQLGSFKHITTYYSSPGGTSERIFLYYCEVSDYDVVPGSGGGIASEGEDIEIIEFDLPVFYEKLEKGFFQDAKIIIAGLWLKAFNDQSQQTIDL